MATRTAECEEMLVMINENHDQNISDATPSVMLTVGQLKHILKDVIETVRSGKEDNEERLLDAHEAAEILGLSTDWLYRNAKKLPFTRKLGPKTLRFSYQGIVKWLATRKPAN